MTARQTPLKINDLTENQIEETGERVIRHFSPSRKLEKVLFIVPPDIPSHLFSLKRAKQGRYADFPPYGCLVLYAHLSRIHIETQIIDLNHVLLKQAALSEETETFHVSRIWKQATDEAIARYLPDLLGLTCMFSGTHDSFREVAIHIRRHGIPITSGGVHVSHDPLYIFRTVPEIDFIFENEAEISFIRFINAINRKGSVKDLFQLWIQWKERFYRWEARTVPSSEELDAIPLYRLIPLDEYGKYGTIGSFTHLLPNESRTATALGNRGCRARCTFCAVRHFSGKHVRHRSISSVTDELELIRNHYGINHIMWLDDDLFYNERRIIALFNEMVRRNLKRTWDATNGVIAYSCTDEVISAASESGCIGLHIGIESGSPAILKRIRKPGNVDIFIRAAGILRKYENIAVSGFIMIGFPHETMGQIWETIQLCRKMDLDWYSIGTLQPIKGTVIYGKMRQEGLIRKETSNDRRFLLGPNGRIKEVEQELFLHEKKDITRFPTDYEPTASDLSAIWFHMDYHLNYQRLLAERRPVKIRQLMKISNLPYRDHPFALYFLILLQKRINDTKDNSRTIDRLKAKLERSRYWRHQFERYHLSAENL